MARTTTSISPSLADRQLDRQRRTMHPKLCLVAGRWEQHAASLPELDDEARQDGSPWWPPIEDPVRASVRHAGRQRCAPP